MRPDLGAAINDKLGNGSGGGEPPDKEGDEDKLTQREKLLFVAMNAELWRDEDHVAYATVQVGKHQESYPIRGLGFKRWMVARYGEVWSRFVSGVRMTAAPSETAIGEARNALEAQAMTGPVHVPRIRLGGSYDRVVLDLGTDDWSAVEITPAGWRIVATPHVKLVRSPGLTPLPRPASGGKIEELREVLHFGEPGDPEADARFKLYVGWLVASLAPAGAYPILAVSGEQGSGKSTVSTAAKRLVDPHRAMRRSLPATAEDLYIAAVQTHALMFDNASEVQSWLADELSKLSTGGSYGKRTRYTDSEETYLTVRNPVVLNGIPDLATRADLADRCFVIRLPRMEDAARRDDAELEEHLARLAPRILGALLDGVVAALANRGEVVELIQQQDKPRMLDATVWIEAAASAFGWPRWSFLNAYLGNRQEAFEVSMESDIVAVAVRALIDAEGPFVGEASHLLAALNRRASDDIRRSRGWPKVANHLAGRLRRAAPGLRRLGFKVEDRRVGEKRNVEWTIAPPPKSGE